MSVNIQETSIAFGKKKQTDLVTANVLAGIWKLSKVNAELAVAELKTESNADDIGKGHEFETQSYLNNWDVRGRIEKFASSEFAAWAFGFGLGKSTKTGTGPYTYTCTPLDPITDGIELPSFSFLQALRQSVPVLDEMYVGCVVEGFEYLIETGPTRAAHKINVDFVGSGKITTPSGITHPAITSEHALPQSSAAITINGVNYVSNKNIVSARFGWQNNLRLDEGFYPGSGTQNGAAIRGRMEFGKRVPSFSFVARFDENSLELTKLKNQTSGTAVLTTTYDADENLTLTLQQMVFRAVVLGNNNGIVTVQVEGGPQYHTSNGLVTAVAETAINDICQ